VTFHVAVGLGLTGAAVYVDHGAFSLILGILVVGERIIRRWIAAQSVAGRVIGGAYRIVSLV